MEIEKQKQLRPNNGIITRLKYTYIYKVDYLFIFKKEEKKEKRKDGDFN